jgi:D-alanyl-D-alanine carboxypeptidase
MGGLNRKSLIITFGLVGIFFLFFILWSVGKLPLCLLSVSGCEREAKITENENVFPVARRNTDKPALSAISLISVYVASDGQERILVEKNRGERLPIASITKLIVALVASQKYKPDDIVTISQNSLNTKGLSGIYHAGDRFFFTDALHALLIASHNEVAIALAEPSGTDEFLRAMNEKAWSLGLSNTTFANVTGLDPTVGSEPINRSTVFDIYKLARYIEENHPDLFSITAQKEFGLFDINKNFVRTITSTDKLLTETDIPFRIIGGKTGETPRAKQNLVIVTETPCGGKMFDVVLGSQNRFEDMDELLQYINRSYEWSCPNSRS